MDDPVPRPVRRFVDPGVLLNLRMASSFTPTSMLFVCRRTHGWLATGLHVILVRQTAAKRSPVTVARWGCWYFRSLAKRSRCPLIVLGWFRLPAVAIGFTSYGRNSRVVGGAHDGVSFGSFDRLAAQHGRCGALMNGGDLSMRGLYRARSARWIAHLVLKLLRHPRQALQFR